MLWLYLVIFTATIFFLFYKYFTRKFDYWKKKNIFYIKPVPFFGNMLDILSPENPIGKNILKLCNAAGNRDYFGIFVFDRPTLIVTSPKLIKSILNRDFSYFTDRSIPDIKSHPIMSNMLFVQKNPLWRDVRSKMNQIFTSSKLKLTFPLMLEESRKMTDYISKIANVPNIEAKDICSKYATNVIIRYAFAVDAKCFEDNDSLFRKLGRQMFDFRLRKALRQMVFFFAPRFASFFNINFVNQEIIDMLENVFSEVLRQRMAFNNFKGIDIVDIMIETNRKYGNKCFSEQAMLGQAIEFFAAGSESVSGVLSYTLYELCINKDKQDKLRNEITTYLKQNNNIITYEAIQEIQYLEDCILETLRKYSGLPYLERTCKADYRIEGTNVIIEKGIVVYIPTEALHYNPKYFPEPEKYIPERFSDKTSLKSSGTIYFPFGEGPRACIGWRFGLNEIKLALISTLTKYRLEPSDKTPIPMKFAKKSLILQSDVGIPLKFVPI